MSTNPEVLCAGIIVADHVCIPISRVRRWATPRRSANWNARWSTVIRPTATTSGWNWSRPAGMRTGPPPVTKRLALLELGLRWTEIEVRAHSFLTDPVKADRGAVKKTLDERFALMREVFQKTPLALNVAYISWGEDALWSRLGWERPRTGRKPRVPRSRMLPRSHRKA